MAYRMVQLLITLSEAECYFCLGAWSPWRQH